MSVHCLVVDVPILRERMDGGWRWKYEDTKDKVKRASSRSRGLDSPRLPVPVYILCFCWGGRPFVDTTAKRQIALNSASLASSRHTSIFTTILIATVEIHVCNKCKTSQELRMLSPSLFIQGSQLLILLFSIVRNVTSVSSLFEGDENLKTFRKSENVPKIWKF